MVTPATGPILPGEPKLGCVATTAPALKQFVKATAALLKPPTTPPTIEGPVTVPVLQQLSTVPAE